MKQGDSGKPDGVIALARETADALGRLTVEHLRLVRLEMKADLQAMTRRAAVLASLGTLLIVGYGLGMAGLAILLGEGVSAGSALLIIGGTHFLVAGVAIIISLLRLRRMRLLASSAGEMNQTLMPLGLVPKPAPAAGPPSESAAAREGRS